MRKLAVCAVALMMLGSVTPAFAQMSKKPVAKKQTQKGKVKKKYKPFMVVDFATGNVNGKLYRPAGTSIMLRGDKKFKSLIQVRASFVQQMTSKANSM